MWRGNFREHGFCGNTVEGIVDGNLFDAKA
jgi:hypothetical protein